MGVFLRGEGGAKIIFPEKYLLQSGRGHGSPGNVLKLSRLKYYFLRSNY